VGAYLIDRTATVVYHDEKQTEKVIEFLKTTKKGLSSTCLASNYLADGVFTGFEQRSIEPEAQQNGRTYAKRRWIANVGLYDHPVMHYAGNGDEVGELVKSCPALAAEALDHGVRGSCSQGDHEHERKHPDGDEWSFGDIAWNRRKLQIAVEQDVSQKVQQRIERRQQSKGAPMPRQPLPAGELRKSVTISVINTKSSASTPAVRVTNSTGFAPSFPFHQSHASSASGSSELKRKSRF
jgi:hypothetical protein